MQVPFISIVIPTRNRGHLVQYALQSALNQKFDDYEIIVSDNCSQDQTASVVQEIGAGRVRYIKPGQVLAMPDHWEFALQQARGRFVVYLCDDDAWAPGVLERVSSLLDESASRLVVLNSGVYFGHNWLDPESRNVATFSPYTGEVRECDSDETLRRTYASCQTIFDAPRMLNSFCDRETLMRVRKTAGRIFMLCPDYSFLSLILTEIPSWLYIDEPLHLQGVFAEGIGSSSIFNRGEPLREFVREFDDGKILRRVPLQAPVVSNYIAETLLMAKEKLPDKLGGYEIDWSQYFINCWGDILRHEENGVNVAIDKQEFYRVVAEQPAMVQAAVGKVIGETRSRPLVKRSIRKLINSSSLLTNLESRVRQRGERSKDGPFTVAGAAAGFHNILECAQQLPALAHRAAVA